VYKNGSKRAINVGGAYSEKGKFVFYTMDRQVKETVLENMKVLHRHFPKMFLLLGEAPHPKGLPAGKSASAEWGI